MNGQLQPGTVLASQAQVHYKVLSLLGLRNDSRENWTYLKADGTQVPIAPGRSAAIVRGAGIDFGLKKGEFR